MKKLLFLAGLIMVAAACSSGTSSGFMGTNDEKNSDCCYSIVFSGYDKEGRSAYDFCKAEFDETNQTLILSLISGKTFSYPKDEIKDEYLSQVKSGKVTMLCAFGKKCPVVVEKEKTQNTKNITSVEYDNRQFAFNSILKSDQIGTGGVIPYRQLYLGLYMLGYCKPGNKMFKDNCFFFYERDFAAEKTGDEFQAHGRFSAARTLDNDYTMCQARFENQELVIRVEDGSTFRYPVELFFTPHEQDVVTGKAFFAVSAVQIPNRNWLPAVLCNNKASLWYAGLIHDSPIYFSIFGRMFSFRDYLAYMEARGVQNIIGQAVTEPFFDISPK